MSLDESGSSCTGSPAGARKKIAETPVFRKSCGKELEPDNQKTKPQSLTNRLTDESLKNFPKEDILVNKVQEMIEDVNQKFELFQKSLLAKLETKPDDSKLETKPDSSKLETKPEVQSYSSKHFYDQPYCKEHDPASGPSPPYHHHSAELQSGHSSRGNHYPDLHETYIPNHRRYPSRSPPRDHYSRPPPSRWSHHYHEGYPSNRPSHPPYYRRYQSPPSPPPYIL